MHTYTLRLVWLDGSVTYSREYPTALEAHQAMLSFADVSLIDHVEVL